MNKKQKLRNAVILGLLMSSVTVGSAWADLRAPIYKAGGDYYFKPIINNWEIKNITGSTEGVQYGIWVHANGVDEGNYTVELNNLTVDVTAKGAADQVVGIYAGRANGVGKTDKKSSVSVWADNNITVNTVSEKGIDNFAVAAREKGEIILNGKNIDVTAIKNTNDLMGDVYAVSAYYGSVDIDATTGNIDIKAKDISDVNETNSVIYGVSNVNGTVDLTAGNVISINANSANGDAYGIIANSDKLTTLKSKFNQITAVADGTGTAIGIKAENGSKVDITGDTYVHGDNGAIVIIGNGINNNADGESEKQFTADDNLFVSADNGTVITIENGASEHVKGNLISASGDKDNAYSNISLTDRSSLTVDGYAVIQGGKTGLELNNSTATFGKDGVSNYIIANEKALSMNNNSALTVNGSSIFVAGAGNSTAIEVAGGSQFTSNGSVTALGGAHGIVLGGNGQFTINDAGINFIKASAAREDVVNQNEHYNAVNVGAGAKFDVSGNLNVLQAGKIDNYFGSETAVSIVGSDTEDGEAKFILTGELGNLIQGAVYSQAGDVKISAKGNNEIYSAAHGYTTGNDGSEHLVSALYAAEDANINLSTENGVNIIKSNAEFIHKDENNHFIDREITVWAENGGNVNIKGAVDIESSNNATYYENGKNGNALGIAISAGGRDLQTDSENNMITPSEWGKVNVDYSSVAQQTSRIIGDIVAGYGGEVNVGQNLAADLLNGQIISTGGDSKLYMEGNALAGNGGKLNLDLGNGGVWYGRADNYGDAGYGETAKNHTNFYNPAFSNGIVEGGTVNIKGSVTTNG